MRRARSIRAWLLGLCAALLLIVAGVQLLFGTSLARAYFLGQKKAEMETFFSYIRANYTDDKAALFELLREGEDVQNIRVAIYDGDGRLLYTTRAMHEAFGALPRFPDGESGVTFSETPEAVELPARSDENAQLSLAGTFSHQGETRYVLLWVLVASVESSLQAFSRVSLWIVAAVLAAGSLASFLIARKISRPIREIRHVSRQMAGLDFSARADETAPVAELRDLAVSVNRMAEQLSAAVTELRADVDRQRRLEQMQREFVANVSHDMKTPLCLLQMYAENLKNNVAGIDKDYYCDTIIDETARLSEMVGSMLQLSAVESGLAGAERLPLDLGQLCSQALARLAPVLAEVRLETALAGAWPVTGDARALTAAVENLLSNAAAHTPPGGTVAVRLEAAGEQICLTVANQGDEIPEDRLPRLWERFYRADEARVRGGQVHVGLGLAIVRSVITRHGGTCRAENTGDGVAFAVTLPRRRE